MDLGLKGKKAIITGGSKGIGLASAHALADEGADVAICSRNIDDVNSALEALKGKGVNAIGGAVDVADGDALKAWIASAISDLGGLDILVPQVSAGGGNPSEEGWAANFETDIMGTVRSVEASLEALRESNGSIVIISTTTAIEQGPGSGPYGAVKAGLLNYSNHIAQTEGPNGVRSNVICPGPIYIKRLDVVLVAGGKYHDIDFARLELLKLLAEDDRIRTRVYEDYSNLHSISNADFLITYTCDVRPTLEQQKVLRDFVANGKRWLALHGTNSILQFLSDGRVD